MINEETQRRIKVLESEGHDKSKKSPRGHKKKHNEGHGVSVNFEHSTEELPPTNGAYEHTEDNNTNMNGIQSQE